MSETVRVTVLVENTAEDPGLLAEHGLAYGIQIGVQRFLFDTGQGNALLGNAHRLGFGLSGLDAIALSHGHYDHTGGLAEVLRGEGRTTIFAHPSALQPKFARNKDGGSRAIGIPPASAEALHRRRERLVFTKEPTRLGSGLMITGPIPRVTDFEDTGGPFFLDAPCRQPDPLVDDQAIYFASARGTVVLLGCAHAGVVNTLRYVQALTGGQPIHAVLGGMHLVNASPERTEQTIEALSAMEIECLGPAHCTGRAATAALWAALPDRCIPCHVGTRLEFELAGSGA